MDDESHDHVLPGSDDELTTPDVQGYDFRGEFDFQEMLEAYATTGFQATQLAEAIDIAEQMQDAGATILSHVYVEYYFIGTARGRCLPCSRRGYVDVLITTSGSLAEDVIKTAKPFKMGEWDSDEAALREQGINRLGNLFFPLTVTSG